MFDQQRIRALTRRISGLRADLLRICPFFGRLLLRLPIGYAECGTAYTDMKSIVFDPSFAEMLGDRELEFLFLHEVLHCVLLHCTRGRELLPHTFNIACDIVVNSLALEIFGIPEMDVGGKPVMHLAPNGNEGKEYTAENIYEMLMDRSSPDGDRFSRMDDHSVWQEVEAAVNDVWNSYVKEAMGKYGVDGIPESVKRQLKKTDHTPKVDWKQLLHDFIQHNRGDYLFSRPDRRFQGNILLPSFVENADGDEVDGLWVLVDTSGSISDEKLAISFSEIRSAIAVMDRVEGLLSFFDDEVSEPVKFESIDELDKIEPVGGGGTSFVNIFKYLDEAFTEPPVAIIILTDGEADYPDEDAALGVPVMWIVIDSKEEPPWGVVLHID